MKQCYLVFWMVIGLIGQASGVTLNPLIKDQESVGYEAVAVLNEQLLYEKEVDDQTELWVYNPATGSTQKILTLDGSFFSDRFYTNYQGAIYFLNSSSGTDGSGVWRTNLTVAGTSELPGDEFVSGYFKQSNGLLFAKKGQSGGFVLAQVTAEGVNTTTLPVLYDFDNQDFICAFDSQNLVVISSNQDFSTTVNRYHDGTITELAELAPRRLGVEVKSMFVEGENCFIAVSEEFQNTGTELLRITADGEVNRLNEVAEFADARIQQFLVINDRVFAAGSSSFNRFAEDYLSFDLSTPNTNGFGGSSFKNARVFQNHIVTVETINADPPPTFVSFFNQSLERVDPSSVIGQNRYFIAPEVYPLAGKDLLLFNIDRNAQVRDLVVATANITPSAVLKNRTVRVTEVIAAEDSATAYFNVRATNAQNSGIYVLADQPQISDQANGPWIDLNFERQGVVISKGQRFDGTEYIFVTIYTYRNGEPFWLAGTADLNLLEPGLTIPISQYRGIGLFEQAVTPDEETTGSIELTFTGCDTMDAQIEYQGETIQMDLRRVDDVTFADLCSD